MAITTGGRVDYIDHDNLIAKLYPPTDTFLVELKTAGAYKRGTVLSREEDGSYEVLGSGTGKASAVVADDTMDGDGTAVAYRSGHFNRLALIVAEDYELTADDENDLRGAGILLTDMVYAPSEDSTKESYTQEELNAMTISQIKSLAEEKGYTITKSVKDEIITEFLEQQGQA
jgi:hypothetical protein